MNTAIPDPQTNTLRVYGLHTGFARTELAFEGRAAARCAPGRRRIPPEGHLTENWRNRQNFTYHFSTFHK